MASFLSRFFNLRKSPIEQIESPRRAFGYTAGISVTEDTAYMASAYYRGLMYISTQIAKLPWEVKDAQNRVIEDDLTKLLRLRVNPEMSSFMFRLVAIQTALHKGNFYAEIERRFDGRPVALWPIPTEAMQVERLPDGRLIYKALGLSAQNPGADAYIAPANIFHLRNFHTKDGIMGQGLAAYAIDALGINLASDRAAKNLFANGGLPSGVITVEGTLDDDAYQRVKESWNAAYGGKNSGRTAVLEQNAKYTPVSMDPQMMQFLDSRKFSVIELARFLGLPPVKLMDTTAATYSNVENSNLEVVTDTLDAWAVNLETETDIKILNMQYGGKFSELDLYSVFRGDMTTRSNYFSKMMQAAAITPNEIRMREGQVPYAGGDRYFLAVNNFSPMDRVDELIDSQINKGGENANPSSVPDPEDNDQGQLTAAAIEFLRK